MSNTSGFYKFDGELLFGPNFVLNAAYALYSNTKDLYQYPVDGWYWFDTLQQAQAFFEIPELEVNEIGKEL